MASARHLKRFHVGLDDVARFALDRLVRTRGTKGAATVLGVTSSMVDAFAFGGTGLPATAQRMAAAILEATKAGKLG